MKNEESPILRHVYALLLCPVIAQGAVSYEVAVRPVDPSDMGLNSPNAATPPIVTQYFVAAGKVRAGGARAKMVYLFDDRTMYAIDNTSRIVHVLKHATLGQVSAHYADAVKQLQEAAANAAPDDRAEAERKASDMKAVSDRIRQPVLREYRVTVRFESVDGHACRIWEMREQDAKRLELCVAPTASIPGGAEMLGGMRTLSQFRQGANFAFGVEFGLTEWWQDFSLLGGVPLLIREYKYDSPIAEVMLSAMKVGAPSAQQFDLPDGFRTEDGPDYTQWLVR